MNNFTYVPNKQNSDSDLNVVIGLGYVGLTLALTLASSNQCVLGYDIDNEIVESLAKGKTRVQEPGIQKLLTETLGVNLFPKANFQEFSRPEGVTCNFFLCVSTPRIEGQAGLSTDSIINVVNQLGPILKHGDAVIMRSTVPIGTGKLICELLLRNFGLKSSEDYFYVSAPERTLEGNALSEIKSLPQLIAGMTHDCLVKGESIFQVISNSIVRVSSVEACELAKVAANAYRDYTFAFSNYLAAVSRIQGIDVDDVINSVNTGYKRGNIPNPSPGVGGPCLSKDPYLMDFLPTAYSLDYSPIISARKLNESVPHQLLNFIEAVVPSLNEKYSLSIGLAFKGEPEVKDLRNSTPLQIAKLIDQSSLKSCAVDAVADLNSISILKPEDMTDLELSTVSLFLILNNHKSNLSILEKYVRKNTSLEIWIFDPWRLLNTRTLKWPEKAKVNVITMSKVICLQDQGTNK